jgi:predicted regulator of Ras-like GTPase activity (Roadblock/LC7/MglB family)
MTSAAGLQIYEQQLEELQAVLERILEGSQCRCALLISPEDGSLLLARGVTRALDTASLAALAAAAFASTREIARLIGESEFTVLFHQGRRDHIHISLAGESAILMILFDDRTTVGMVRLYARENGQKIARILGKGSSSASVGGIADDA